MVAVHAVVVFALVSNLFFKSALSILWVGEGHERMIVAQLMIL